MKKVSFILVALLMLASLYRVLSPVKEIRYNASNKTVDCSKTNALPEGCAASVKPTVLQTWSGNLVILTSLGLTGIGGVALGKSMQKRKEHPVAPTEKAKN